MAGHRAAVYKVTVYKMAVYSVAVYRVASKCAHVVFKLTYSSE